MIRRLIMREGSTEERIEKTMCHTPCAHGWYCSSFLINYFRQKKMGLYKVRGAGAVLALTLPRWRVAAERRLPWGSARVMVQYGTCGRTGSTSYVRGLSVRVSLYGIYRYRVYS